MDFLRTQDESLLTSENRPSLRALAEEFAASRLIQLCSKHETADVSRELYERVLDLFESAPLQREMFESVERDFPQSLCEFVAAQLLPVSEDVRDLRNEVAVSLQDRRKGTDNQILGIAEEVR
jgi:hypothetical protein